MCLDVSHSYSKPQKGRGYKVFRRWKGDASPHPQCIGSRRYPIGEWVDAEDTINWQTTQQTTDNKLRRYTVGFHIFTRLEDAKRWRLLRKAASLEIREVEYKDAHTFGYQLKKRRGHCVVAPKMRIGKVIVRATSPIPHEWYF